MSDFDRRAAAITGRLRNMVGRGTIAAVDDGPMAQEIQVEGMDDEVHDHVERFGDYGFVSNPLPGAEVATVAVGGTRSHQIVVGIVDRRHRVRGLQPGEVAMHDDQGQLVILRREGIEIHTDKPLTIVYAAGWTCHPRQSSRQV